MCLLFKNVNLINDIKKLKLYKPIIFIGTAHSYDLLDYFDTNLTIYHCSDDYTLVPSFPESFGDLEQSLIKECEIVVTTADELKESKKKYNPNTISIPNGANITHFFKAQHINTKVPEVIKHYKKPVVGYIGSIFRWLNIDWIDFASRKFPDYHFVPCFWMATEDHDFKEVNHINLFGKNLPKITPK